MATFSSRLRDFWNHPAGPKTIFFWAPTFKWGISLANLSDLNRDPDLVSTPTQVAVTATGIIWSKYSLDITPKNYNLLAVNAFMACTGAIQLYRKYVHEQKKKIEAKPDISV
jgi:mitochondrial pyruvate carrier 2